MHSHAKATASDIHNFICQRKSRSNLLRIQNVHLYSYSPLSVTKPPKTKATNESNTQKVRRLLLFKIFRSFPILSLTLFLRDSESSESSAPSSLFGATKNGCELDC
jgi:hypothetical protein